MRLLLDSHVLLWWLVKDRRLADRHRRAIGDPSNFVSVSAASVWELAIKSSLGKLELPDRFAQVVAAEFPVIPVELPHAAKVAELPLLHRDPFDRLLVAQCLLEGLTLATVDPILGRYGIPILTP